MLHVAVDPEVVTSLDVVVALRQGFVNLVRCLKGGEVWVIVQLWPAGDPQVSRRLVAYQDGPLHVLPQLVGQLLELLDDDLRVAGTRCRFSCLRGDVAPGLDLEIVKRISDSILLRGQISLLSRTHVMNSGWKQRLLLAGLRTMSRANSTWYSPGSRSMYFMACCQFFVVV